MTAPIEENGRGTPRGADERRGPRRRISPVVRPPYDANRYREIPYEVGEPSSSRPDILDGGYQAIEVPRSGQL